MSVRARRGRRGWKAAAVTVLFTGALGIAPGAAVAESSVPNPLWYAEAMKVSAIHDAGITGKGITIAVFDGKLNLDAPGIKGADIEVRDVEGCPDPAQVAVANTEDASHGTSVVSLVVGRGSTEVGSGPMGIAPDVRVLYYGILQTDCDKDLFDEALDDAVSQGTDIVTYSGARLRLSDEFAVKTAESVTRALQRGVAIVTALPNDDTTTEGTLETMNGVVNVAAVDSAAQPATDTSGAPMRYEDVDVVAPGVDVAGVGFDGTWGLSSWSGTSAATPLVAGVLALAKQKWPDASSNQLLQSLIRNTGSQPHELTWGDALGHGVVNATRMMEVDPSQYPDENPLFKDDQLPAYDDVYPEPVPSATPTAVADDGLSVLPWAVGGGVVIALGILLTVVLVRVRRSRRPAGAPSPR